MKAAACDISCYNSETVGRAGDFVPSSNEHGPSLDCWIGHFALCRGSKIVHPVILMSVNSPASGRLSSILLLSFGGDDADEETCSSFTIVSNAFVALLAALFLRIDQLRMTIVL